jgi:hypothetical protein
VHTGEDLAEHEVVFSGKTKEELTKAIVEGLHLLFDSAGVFPEPRQLDSGFDIFSLKHRFSMTGWRPVKKQDECSWETD